ncbi:hypothetical protein V3C99_009376 [Haemonchus contortus]
MTVNYNLCVATSHPWTILRILLRWRGSVWKAVGIESAIWLLLYILISVVRRQVLSAEQQSHFEKAARVLDQHMRDIPTDFMLGFFVTVIVTRWSTLFNNIGLIENLAHAISACIRGSDDATRTRRRNIIRYCVVAQLLAFRDISVQVRKRFPTMDTIVASGFLMRHELEELEGLNSAAAHMGKHGCLYGRTWIPIEWAITLLKRARYNDETISSDILLVKCLEELRRFRTNLLTLTNYDWVPIPIMYPQLVSLAVHLFFFIALFSRQFSPSDDTTVEYVIPLMSCLQFTFYMGWLKVAEALLNPFGEDDDDFECNFLLDRNLVIGISIVDDGHDRVPEQMKDEFWQLPIDLLYSSSSVQRYTQPLTGSAAAIELPTNVNEITMMSLNGRECDCSSPRKISIIRSSSSVASPSMNGVVSSIRRKISRGSSVSDQTQGPVRQLSVRDDVLPSWIDHRLSIVPESPDDSVDNSQNSKRTRSLSCTDRPPLT